MSNVIVFRSHRDQTHLSHSFIEVSLQTNLMIAIPSVTSAEPLHADLDPENLLRNLIQYTLNPGPQALSFAVVMKNQRSGGDLTHGERGTNYAMRSMLVMLAASLVIDIGMWRMENITGVPSNCTDR